MESLPLTTIVSALETRSASTGFAENYQKVEKSPVFAQKAPEPIVSGHSKCADDVDMPLALTTISTALKMHLETAAFMKNHKNHRKSAIFTKNYPKSPILGCFKRANNAEPLLAPSILPMKHPCDLSSLFSNEFILLIHFLNIQLAITHPCFMSYFSISIF